MWTYPTLLLVHLLATTFWVGGMAVMHVCVRPAAVATLAPPQRLPLMADALRRFVRGVAVAVVAVWLSGLGMIEVAGGMAVVLRHVHLMLALGLAMTLVYALVAHQWLPRLTAAVARQDWPAAGAALSRIRMLVAVNIGLGVAVHAVALLGRTWATR
ncbi:MAG: hypothetical protein RLZZ524_397 [Pseudomonadota bacterium]|jgi:uncharacterized membrane protein